MDRAIPVGRMKKISRSSLLWAGCGSVLGILVLLSPGDPENDPIDEACTAFAFRASGSRWVGKNLDWAVEDGIIAVNERGVRKEAWGPDHTSGFSWVSTFGSVTFNQFGWGFPLGGINEAGLVVEELSYSPTRYPPTDLRPALNELQWIQYQLDNSSSVEEVLASDTLVRITRFLFGVHYLAADRSGSVAVIEFLDGKRKVHFREDLPVEVLANDTYENSVRYLRHHVGFGGSRAASDGPESPERFVRAATLLQDHGVPPGARSPREFAFQILASVKQSDTQWSIVYRQDKVEVSFKSSSRPSTRTISLDTLDFSCRGENVAVPMSWAVSTWLEAGGSWTAEKNGKLVRSVLQQLGARLNLEELPPPETIADLASYPLTTRCGSG
jgi:choloylglycine hydrolase